MTKTVYSMVVLNPINFPDEIEIQYHPLDPVTEQPTGGCYSLSEHRSWGWIRNSWPIANPAYFDECEGYLKQGFRANLVRGEHLLTVDDEEQS
jgi:hypothetical protein